MFRWVLAAASLCLALAGAVAVASVRDDEVSCAAPLPSPVAWSSGEDAQTDEGHRLVECGRLIALTAGELERLLGPPTERLDNDLAWQLGPDGMGIDFLFLGATLDAGRVVSARVYQG